MAGLDIDKLYYMTEICTSINICRCRQPPLLLISLIKCNFPYYSSYTYNQHDFVASAKDV